MNKYELAGLIETCAQSKNNIKSIKETSLKILIDAIIQSRKHKEIIKAILK